MNSAIASEVWVDDALRRWKIAFAYFMEAYLVTTLYLLYGTVIILSLVDYRLFCITTKSTRDNEACVSILQNFREWDLLQFFSSTVVILWVPMRELFGVVS